MKYFYLAGGILTVFLAFNTWANTPDKPVTNLGSFAGRDIIMQADKAKLDQSSLARIQGIRYLSGMLMPDSGANWEIDVRKEGDYIIEVAYVFPWTSSASAKYELQAGKGEPFTWFPATTGGGSSDGGICHLGQMILKKGKQTFTLKKKGSDGIYLSYIRLIPVEAFPVVKPESNGALILSPNKALIQKALIKEWGKKPIVSHMQKISWNVEVPKERPYKLELEYAAGAPSTTVSTATLYINDKEMKLPLPGTGSYGRFAKSNPLPITIPEGKVNISLSGVEFKNLKLTPQ